jgi:DNA (cytosine-5)-methyltransferase 1
MKAISLFACGGIGDLGLRRAGFDVIVANELLEDRAEVFKSNYPESHMIIGDIWGKRDEILSETTSRLSGEQLDLVFATPPCQGMSKNGRGKLLSAVRQGLKDAVDQRNLLVIPTIDIFLRSGAHTLVMENVPEMEYTCIPHPTRSGELIGIVDLIKESLGDQFISCVKVVEFANYGVPQCRQRLISIFSKHHTIKQCFAKTGTLFPKETHSKDGINKKKWTSVRDAISHLPALDAGNEGSAQSNEIEYHRVPLLDRDKYLWVSSTPAERGAFDNQCGNPSCGFQGNPTHGASKDEQGVNRSNTDTPLRCAKCGSILPRPWVIEAGEYRLMKGYTSAYKRMSWDSPASTLTRNLSYACSDNKLHPEQNRVLSLHEAMILHTISDHDFFWKRADGRKVSDKLIRELIGESIPPSGIEKVFLNLSAILRGDDVGMANEDRGQQALCLHY